ncbi:MAG TPA: phosphate ABC transporter permease subunit PstC [Bacteroidetes bacterium]|nr:phosphate ABC transporter permease subunit PstC [Bacteroidota bacterium]HEX03805.1 phosphate ABC transporter permease subunit PstC [Bacteroidota bacterium]
MGQGPSHSGAADSLLKKRKFRLKEEAIKTILFLCAILSVVTTISIIVVLGKETFPFFQDVPILDFLFGTEWTPLLVPRSFGVLPLVSGTLLIVVGAALIAIPIGLASGIYLAEYASDRVRSVVKPILEILVGIPTVVYGYFAISFVTPLLRVVFPSTNIFNAASASIVVSIMVLPMVASLCDDAIRAVPSSLRQGAYALGATPFEVTTRVVVPASLSGVVASYVLAISRATGETISVTLAAGATPNMTLNPLGSIQTMTAYIVQVSLGDTPAGSVEYQTIFAVATLLFVITLSMNVIAHRVLRRFREVYE